MVAGFDLYVSEYCLYAQRVFFSPARSNTLSRSPTRCTTPPVGLLKINVAAHVFESLYVRLGVVVRNDVGKMLMTTTKRVGIGWKVEMTEATSVRYGLQVARRSGFTNVWLDSDALNVIKAIDDQSVGISPLFLFYDDIRKLSHSFSSVFSLMLRGLEIL